MRELLLFLSSEQVEIARHPHAYLCIHEFLILEASFLKKQLQNGLTFFLYLFLFLAHITFLLFNAANLRNYPEITHIPLYLLYIIRQISAIIVAYLVIFG